MDLDVIQQREILLCGLWNNFSRILETVLIATMVVVSFSHNKYMGSRHKELLL